MEPSVLRLVDGNVVGFPGGSASAKKKGFGRGSLARASLASTVWDDSPVKGSPAGLDKWGPGDGDGDEDSWIGATPVQRPRDEEMRLLQTLPVSRVRKLQLPELDQTARRRLTTWDLQD